MSPDLYFNTTKVRLFPIWLRRPSGFRLNFNTTKVRLFLSEDAEDIRAWKHFNTTKVRLFQEIAMRRLSDLQHFNTTKVRLFHGTHIVLNGVVVISIPQRCDYFSLPAQDKII